MPADAVAPTPWKNGGGRTRTLLALPAEDDWQLRISMADVEQDGPFSPYPGVERWLALVDGDGMRLEFGNRAVELTPRDPPLAFDGTDAPYGRLLQGATRDLNLMNRGGEATMQAALPGVAWRSGLRACGLFSLHGGRWSCADGRSADLGRHALLWLDTAPGADMVFDQAGLWLAFSAPAA